MNIHNLESGFRHTYDFPDGDSTTDVSFSNHRNIVGFLLFKARSSNDSVYAVYSFVCRDNGDMAFTEIQKLSFYDLDVSISGGNDKFTVDLTDGSGGGTTGGTATMEAIYI